MSQWVYEHADGRKIGKDRSRTSWVAQGFMDELSAEQAVLAEAPAVLGNAHILDGHRLDKRFRSGVYVFSLTYRSPRNLQQEEPPSLETGEWSFSFDTTGASERITQALATRAYTSAGRSASDDDTFKNAINVRGNGKDISVEGVQVVVPSLKFQIRARLPNSIITTSYARRVSRLTGRTNDAMFPPASMPFVDEQWDADEVLFLGNTGSWASNGDIELTFHFDAGEEVQDLETGDIVAIVKKPHEFVWFRYKKETASNRLIVNPEFAFVEKLYESDDLEQIFTGPN